MVIIILVSILVIFGFKLFIGFVLVTCLFSFQHRSYNMGLYEQRNLTNIRRRSFRYGQLFSEYYKHCLITYLVHRPFYNMS